MDVLTAAASAGSAFGGHAREDAPAAIAEQADYLDRVFATSGPQEQADAERRRLVEVGFTRIRWLLRVEVLERAAGVVLRLTWAAVGVLTALKLLHG